MTSKTVLRAVLWWLVILVLAIANGMLRDGLLVSVMGPFAALVTSGVVLSALILLVAYFAVPGLGPLGRAQYWLVGLVWLAMTLVFESGFGLLVQHKALSELLQAYTFAGGNIWPVVLVVTLVAPRLAAYLRALS